MWYKRTNVILRRVLGGEMMQSTERRVEKSEVERKRLESYVGVWSVMMLIVNILG